MNPVWYLDIFSEGYHEWLTKPLDSLIKVQVENNTFVSSDIAKLTPLIEQMGTGPDYFKEYWWEREWRHVRNFQLPLKYIVICPEEHWAEVSESSHYKLTFIDPTWSLEQIIGRLAGYNSDHIDPF